jgi:hypothetical protein
LVDVNDDQRDLNEKKVLNLFKSLNFEYEYFINKNLRIEEIENLENTLKNHKSLKNDNVIFIKEVINEYRVNLKNLLILN